MTNVYPFRPGAASATSALNEPRAVYTVKEVAHLLSLSIGSTYVLVRDGTVPALRMGGRWVIPRQRFHDWLNSVTDPMPATGTDHARRPW